MHVIPHLFFCRIVEQRVHGEITADRVFFLIAEHVVAQQAAVLIGARAVIVGFGIGMRGTEGGDFNRFVAKHHVHQAKAAADDARAAEDATHLFGRRIGGDIVVFGVFTQQQITHRATDDKRLIARLLQTFADRNGGVRKIIALNAMFGLRINAPLAGLGGDGARVGFGSKCVLDALNEFLDHVCRAISAT